MSSECKQKLFSTLCFDPREFHRDIKMDAIELEEQDIDDEMDEEEEVGMEYGFRKPDLPGF